MPTITISGNIGCGKSTIIENIKDVYRNKPINIYPEPVEHWGSWLDMFYMDQKKFAFPFQMKVLLDFLYLDSNNVNKQPNITERSPLDSLNVFAKTMRNVNNISYMEYNLYKDYVDKIAWKPDIIIYIQTTPNECVRRIKTRLRECESGIDESYIENVHRAYETWMETEKKHKQVYFVDGMRNKESVTNDVLKILDTVLNITRSNL